MTYLVRVPLEDIHNLAAGFVADRLSRAIILFETGRLGWFSLEESLELLGWVSTLYV
jgi:hypothetical protein